MPTGDINVCLEESGAFLKTAEACIDKQPMVGLSPLIYPTVVNASFSCELSFKAIMMVRSGNCSYRSGHKLKTELFVWLSPPDQDEIRRRSEAALSIDFDDALDEFDDAFSLWRYALERPVNIHYLELVEFAKILFEYASEL